MRSHFDAVNVDPGSTFFADDPASVRGLSFFMQGYCWSERDLKEGPYLKH